MKKLNSSFYWLVAGLSCRHHIVISGIYFVDAVLYHAFLFISHCLFKKFTSIPWHSTINSFVIQTKTKITDHPAIIDIKRLHEGCHITLFSGIGCKTYIYNNNKFPNDFQFPLLPPLSTLLCYSPSYSQMQML